MKTLSLYKPSGNKLDVLEPNLTILKLILSKQDLPNSNMNNRAKYVKLIKIYIELSSIKPYNLVLAHKKSNIPKKIIEKLLSLIKKKKSERVEDLVEELKMFNDPTIPNEVHVKTCFSNILNCLNEMKEVISRVDGNFDKQFEISDESPFLFSEYIHFLHHAQELYISRLRYPLERVWMMSENCKRSLSSIATEIKSFDSDPSEEAIQTNNADTLSDYLKTNGYFTQQFTKTSIQNSLTLVTKYLTHLKRNMSIRDMGEVDDLPNSTLSYLENFSFLLHSLPLTKVLRPENNGWVIEGLKDIIYAADQIITEKAINSSLSRSLTKLKLSAYQLWHMSLLQTSSGMDEVLHLILISERAKWGIRIKKVLQISSDWLGKFENQKSNKDILESCPYNECCVCFTNFAKMMEQPHKTARLAALAKCPHLICLQCLFQIYKSE